MPVRLIEACGLISVLRELRRRPSVLEDLGLWRLGDCAMLEELDGPEIGSCGASPPPSPPSPQHNVRQHKVRKHKIQAHGPQCHNRYFQSFPCTCSRDSRILARFGVAREPADLGLSALSNAFCRAADLLLCYAAAQDGIYAVPDRPMTAAPHINFVPRPPCMTPA